MIMLVCSVYDKKVNAFASPFFVRSQGEAIRSFTDACQDGQTVFCKHPEDYLLFQIGEFDDGSGALRQPATGPVPLIEAIQCVKVLDLKPMKFEYKEMYSDGPKE